MLRANPDSPVVIDGNGVDRPGGETIALGVGSELPSFKDDDASLVQAKPYPALIVRAHDENRFAPEQELIRKALHSFTGATIEARVRIKNPKAAPVVIRHRHNIV